MSEDKLRVLDLFSGIGGFSLGLERTGGFETVAFCEIEPFCRKVLAKHWPNVRQYEDVRTLTADTLRRDGISVDVICGGFPCQDISTAGKGAGIAEGTRSGLWSEISRLVGELRPQFVIVENVAALLSRGLDRVLGDLAALGYDAEWHCIPASAVGAPHRRDRVWIVAHPNAGVYASGLAGRENPSTAGGSESGNASEGQASYGKRLWAELSAIRSHEMADPEEELGDVGEYYGSSHSEGTPSVPKPGDGHNEGDVAYTSRPERYWWPGGPRWWSREPLEALFDARLRGREEDGLWIPESELGRVADGVPNNVERLGALGNAVVPQIPELIGRAILEARAA